MRARAWIGCVVTVAILVGGRWAWAEASDEAAGSGSAVEEHADGSGSAVEEHHPDGSGSAVEEHHPEGSGSAVEAPHHEEAGSAEHHALDTGLAPEIMPEAQLAMEMDPDDDPDDGEPPTRLFDEDGDGQVSPEEQADEREYAADFAGISQDMDTAEIDRELDARPPGKQLLPSISVEKFRSMVRVVKKVVLAKMEHKMEIATEKKMATFAKCVVAFSLLGLLLLLMPLGLAKKYPGQGGQLFKYSALAAVTFVVTVNLFGGVLYGMRGVQGALGKSTNPTLAIAAGTFDTLDRHAEEYAVMGKELFAPTLEQLRGSDEQPSVVLLGNGQRVIKDAMVFVSIAKMFKRISFVFSVLPIVLMLVTMVLFCLAIRPTLMEIIRLPATAASGKANAGRDVVGNALRRVKGELLATLCTIGVLAAITLVSGFVLGQVVAPAIDALIYYFSMTISYLQFVEGASSGLVFVTLFAVILFLVLCLAAIILSTAFFLGKMQKIFQAKFNHGVPIGDHLPFIKWAVGAVLLVQLFPWLFVEIAEHALAAINDSVLGGATDPNAVSWGKALMAGPLFLVLGFVVLFWAARGLKAIGYLFRYKVKVPPPAPVT